MKYACDGRKTNQGLSYHLYLIPEHEKLKGRMGCTYGVSMQCDVHKKRKVLLSDVDLFYLSGEQEELTILCLGIQLLPRGREKGTIIVLLMYGWTTR